MISNKSLQNSGEPAVSEVVADAFRAAEPGLPGASFISAPQDGTMGGSGGEVLIPAHPVALGPVDAEEA